MKAKILIAIGVIFVMAGSVAAAVAFRSAIPFGTASSWSSAVQSDPNAVRGPWFNTSEVSMVHTNTGGASGTDWQLDHIQFSVQAFGADPTGVADSTTAINNTCTAAAAAGSAVVFFPAGTYKYTGNGGCTGTAMKFQGVGKDASIISLSAGNYFIDDNQAWNSLQVRGIRFVGGAGAIRNRWNGTDVADYKEVDDCFFFNYTNAAISSNATDDPYWKITRSVFRGANTTTTMGIALAGYSDSDTIQDDEFLNNYIGVKLGRGGNNAHIFDSAFLEFSAGTGRVGIWVVPETTFTNSGQGFVASNIKFGNENQDTSDYKILYADEGAGTYFGDRLYATSVSTGFISGHRVAHVLANGANATTQPVVYSYTAQIAGSHYGPFTIGGTTPSYIVQVNTPPTVDVSATNYGNVIGPIVFANTSIPGGVNGWAVSNAPSMFTTIDPEQSFTASDPNLMMPWTPGSNPAGYTALLTTGVRSFTLAVGATLANISDSAGGTDATEATMPNTSLVYTILNTTPTAGMPMWIEFDVKSGSASPLSNVQVRLQDNSNNIYWRRELAIPSSTTVWKHYRFLFTPRSVPANFNIMFANNTGSSGTIDIGMVRVYHGYEPISGGKLNGLWNDGAATQTGALTCGSQGNAITGAFNNTTTNVAGLSMVNTTAATGGVTVQNSPGLELSGQAWTGSVTEINKFMIQVIPGNGTNQLQFLNSINGAGYSQAARIDQAGNVIAVGALFAGGASATGALNAKTLTITANTFGSLGTPANGTFQYCSDCTIANPCAGSGTGAFAKRLNGVWVCN